jgi:hypothetical protein
VGPLGVQPSDLDTLVGDVTDPAAIEQAVRDCAAVAMPVRSSPWTAAMLAASAR